jgi:hypothetical protein
MWRARPSHHHPRGMISCGGAACARADARVRTAILLANIVFSAIGNGAATRAGTVVLFLAIAFVAFRLLQRERDGVVEAEP